MGKGKISKDFELSKDAFIGAYNRVHDALPPSRMNDLLVICRMSYAIGSMKTEKDLQEGRRLFERLDEDEERLKDYE